VPNSLLAPSRGLLLVALALGCATSTPATPTPTAAPAPQPASSKFMAYPVSMGGKPAGTLRLGETTLAEATKMLPPPPEGTNGALRPAKGSPRPTSGAVIPAPTVVYDPAGSSYQLYFDAHQRLVTVVDAASPWTGKPATELAARYPALHEIYRAQPFSEREAVVDPCTTLMAMVTIADGTVTSVASVFTCATAPAS
jgi:hypothetical protein